VKARYLPIAVAVLGSLPGLALAESYAVREQSRLDVEARGIGSLRVENPRGWIQVGPSRDGRIHLTALKLVRSRSTRQAHEFSRETSVETSTEAGQFVVHVRYPQRRRVYASLGQLFRGELDLPRVEVRLALEVPARLPLRLESSSGDLETTGLTGSQTLVTTSGEVEVRDAGGGLLVTTTSGGVVARGFGPTAVRSVSGDVTLEDARGPLDVRTTSGTIEVRGAADSLRLSTASGDIRVEQAPRGLSAGSSSGEIVVDGFAAGGVYLHSASGDVRLGLGRGVRRAEVRTGSGDISARLADGVGFSLDLESRSGTLDTSIPLRVGAVTRQRMSGAVRGGGPQVILRSLSGDITVTGGGR